MHDLNLAVAITFHYREERLQYLRRIALAHAGIATQTKTFIVTNTRDDTCHRKIMEAVASSNVDIVSPNYLGHPYLLTWIHREIFREAVMTNAPYTHYLYSEDDILIAKENIGYWLQSRQCLPQLLIPGFARYEVGEDGEQYFTDITRAIDFETTHKIMTPELIYINLAQPYQAAYFLDRELMTRFVGSRAYYPNFGPWGIRESAAQGLAFWRIPDGYSSRHFLGLNPDFTCSRGALIHHVANNYVGNARKVFGKRRVSRLFAPLK